MLVTVTGAYKNAGDHLIGDRARSLLRAFCSDEIVNVDRRSISDSTYSLFNSARAVILTGGPAWQKDTYPKIYNIDLSRVDVPVVPFGLGWMAPLDESPESFSFSGSTLEFMRAVHKGISASSVRDVLTQRAIQAQGIKNVNMTGCPAWYDLNHITRDYSHLSKVKKIVYSMPAKPQENVREVISHISKKYPFARKVMAFHHGWQPGNNEAGLRMKTWNQDIAKYGALRGWTYADLSNGLDKFAELYTSADFHIGYRVHAHIYSLSQQTASILISEDARGQGQVLTLGGPNLTDRSSGREIIDAMNMHFDTNGAAVESSVNVIHHTFEKMTSFIASI